jgi:hypothetical protein
MDDKNDGRREKEREWVSTYRIWGGGGGDKTRTVTTRYKQINRNRFP